MRRLVLPLLAGLAVVPSGALQAQRDSLLADTLRTELVVVLHGMGRTSRSMLPVVEALEGAGYAVLNVGYSSYCCDIAELGQSVRATLDSARQSHHRTVHFVGHSLGGILARWMLVQESPPPGVGRLVMIAPPNQGSHTADRYAGVIGWLLEPIDELGTDSTTTVMQLGSPTSIEFGIIAGKHDGKLTIAETRLEGQADHAVVDANHSFIMRNPRVHELMLTFLRTGRFSADSVAAP